MNAGRFNLPPADIKAIKSIQLHRSTEFNVFREMILREFATACEQSIAIASDNREWHAGYASALRRLDATITSALEAKG